MGISGRHRSNSDRSDDSGEYRLRFHRDALCLIVFGYKKLVEAGGDYSSEEEPAITGEIARHLRAYLEADDAPAWVERYTVHDDPPEHDNERKGKRRRRLDISIEYVQKGRRPFMRFEAKRLMMPRFAVDKYIGGSGLGEFLAGHYAREDDVGGMLGYVQSENCNAWAERIGARMEGAELCLAKDGTWQRANVEDVENCYATRHYRVSPQRELLVYHLLLDFAAQAYGPQ